MLASNSFKVDNYMFYLDPSCFMLNKHNNIKLLQEKEI